MPTRPAEASAARAKTRMMLTAPRRPWGLLIKKEGFKIRSPQDIQNLRKFRFRLLRSVVRGRESGRGLYFFSFHDLWVGIGVFFVRITKSQISAHWTEQKERYPESVVRTYYSPARSLAVRPILGIAQTTRAATSACECPISNLSFAICSYSVGR